METELEQLKREVHQINLAVIKIQSQQEFLRTLCFVILGLRVVSGVTDFSETQKIDQLLHSVSSGPTTENTNASNPPSSLPFGLVR